MRDYSKVGSGFWTGKTGKRLRGDTDAQMVALYLTTCSHANMIGIFHCPLVYISHDTGIPLEGASKGLRRLIEEGFCSFDEDRDLVWVHEMARFQIADALKQKDNRIANVAKELSSLPKCQLTIGFFEKYADAFLLKGREELVEFERALEAPSKPLRSQKQKQEQKQEQKEEQKEEECKHPSSASDFEKFWSVYPKRVDRRIAEKAFGKAVKKSNVSVIIAGASAYAEQRVGQDQKYTKNAATWLNNDCWTESPSSSSGGNWRDDPAYAGVE